MQDAFPNLAANIRTETVRWQSYSISWQITTQVPVVEVVELYTANVFCILYSVNLEIPSAIVHNAFINFNQGLTTYQYRYSRVLVP